jgi:hypothetical protein
MTQPAEWRRFPDAPKTLAKILGSSLVAAGQAGTRTPDDFAGLMPYIRVIRVGGYNDGINDYARVAVGVFSDNLSVTEETAEKVRTKLTTEKLRLGPAIVDRVACDSAPQEMDQWAPGINHFEARYLTVFRRYAVRL